MAPITLAFLVAVLLLNSCESESSIPSSGTLPGDIIGYIELTDTLGTKMVDQSGAAVSVERFLNSTISDSTGTWRLNDVPAGTHVLVFQKESFGITKIYNVQHTGNGTWYSSIRGYLRQVPTVSLEDLSLGPFTDLVGWVDSAWTDSLGHVQHKYVLDTLLLYYFEGSCRVSSNQAGYGPRISPRILFSKTTNINNEDPSSYEYMVNAKGDTSAFRFYVYRDSLTKRGYRSGERVYVRAALGPVNYYYEPGQKKYFWSGYGKMSEVRSFIMP
jgi:hypothetical protein